MYRGSSVPLLAVIMYTMCVSSVPRYILLLPLSFKRAYRSSIRAPPPVYACTYLRAFYRTRIFRTRNTFNDTVFLSRRSTNSYNARTDICREIRSRVENKEWSTNALKKNLISFILFRNLFVRRKD